MIGYLLRQPIAKVVVTGVTALVLVACAMITSQPSGESPTTVETAVTTPALFEIITKDHAFEAVSAIEAGWVTIKSKNEGAEPHHVQLLRLNEGVTFEAFVGALQQGIEAGMPLVTLAGGPGPLEPGDEQMVTVELTPGEYVLICLLPDANGVPHVAHGMVAPLSVIAESEVTAAPPQADAEVRLVNFSFILPEEIQAGEQIWKVTNDGDQWHEISLIKLAEGKTATDALHWMHAPAGPPPFTNAGGMQGLDPADSAYLHLNLTPGDYVGLCHIPDLASGKAHTELGMVMQFKVHQ